VNNVGDVDQGRQKMAPKEKMNRFHGFCFNEMSPQPNWRLLLELMVFHGDLRKKSAPDFDEAKYYSVYFLKTLFSSKPRV
jgi:hypothetical protein